MAAGVSVQALADMLGYRAQTIYNYENDPHPRAVSADALFKIADFFGVEERWLLLGEGNRSSARPMGPQPSINQAISCLEAILKTGGESLDLVHAPIALLRKS